MPPLLLHRSQGRRRHAEVWVDRYAPGMESHSDDSEMMDRVAAQSLQFATDSRPHGVFRSIFGHHAQRYVTVAPLQYTQPPFERLDSGQRGRPALLDGHIPLSCVVVNRRPGQSVEERLIELNNVAKLRAYPLAAQGRFRIRAIVKAAHHTRGIVQQL